MKNVNQNLLSYLFMIQQTSYLRSWMLIYCKIYCLIGIL